jgi:hypothetical protein
MILKMEKLMMILLCRCICMFLSIYASIHIYINMYTHVYLEFEWYYDTENGDINSQEYIDECIQQSEKVQEEDIWLCERVQKVHYMHMYLCIN